MNVLVRRAGTGAEIEVNLLVIVYRVGPIELIRFDGGVPSRRSSRQIGRMFSRDNCRARARRGGGGDCRRHTQGQQQQDHQEET
jgi:hypothetical protein